MDFQLAELRSPNPKDRVNMLRALGEVPPTDPTILRACERLLEDSTLTLLGIPYRFGEVRAVAAETVWAIRSSQGIDDAVVLKNVLEVCTTNDVGRMAREAGMPMEVDGVAGVLRTFEKLVAAHKIPRRDLRLETVASKL